MEGRQGWSWVTQGRAQPQLTQGLVPEKRGGDCGQPGAQAWAQGRNRCHGGAWGGRGESCPRLPVDTLLHPEASGTVVTGPSPTRPPKSSPAKYTLTFSSKVKATRDGYSLSAMTTPARLSFRT